MSAQNTKQTKVHKTLRIDARLADSVARLRSGGETETATYCRVLEAGVAALEGGDKEEPTHNDSALVAVLEAHIDTLTEQLAVKDEQIAAAVKLADQAQQLHALQAPQAAIVTATTDVEPQAQAQERRGFWARVFG